MHRFLKISAFVCFAILFCHASARAVITTGTQWRVIWNTPNQTTGWATPLPEEFEIRDAILARLSELQAGDWCGLATYTFSANSEKLGAAGPLLKAMDEALGRGARLAFVGGYGVDINTNFWPNISIAGLKAKYGNRFEYAKAPTSSGIMHHKLCLTYRPSKGESLSMSGSWNFTGGAGTTQWNIMTEIQSPELFAAYSNEVRQLLNGYFHSNTNKSHAFDATFAIPGMTSGRSCAVRFGPYPESTTGGDNALSDIRQAISNAQNEIIFSLNKLTLGDVANDLMAACNRGVFVRGVIPMSDRSGDSAGVVEQFLNADNYTSSNRVQLYLAYHKVSDSAVDDGTHRDLVHTKYMLLDPCGENPLVIHGSANWTISALISTSSNDENILFLPHGGMALAFLEQFDTMTGRLYPLFENIHIQNQNAVLTYWLPDTNRYSIVEYGGWNAVLRDWSKTDRTWALSTQEGTNTLILPFPAHTSAFWGIEKQ